MRVQNSVRQNKIIFGILILSSIAILFLSLQIGSGNYDQVIVAVEMIFFGFITLAIIQQPYLGLVATVVSLPVIELLPAIPFASSAVSLIGGITLVSFLLGKPQQVNFKIFTKPSGLVWGMIFLGWIMISNPVAALLPSEDGRNWLFTFSQLLLLAWLVSELMDTPQKHHLLMWFYSIAAIISAVYSIPQGSIGETLIDSIRGSGLADGANSAARYFIVALIFLNHLRTTKISRIQRLFAILGMGILIFGVMVTVSRTGLILLFAAIGMLSIQRTETSRQGQAGIILALLVIVIWLFADNIFFIIRGIFPAIQAGSDTVGLRYALWEAGFRMWRDNVIQGIGIGQYISQLVFYASDLLPAYRLRLGAHNMYIQILAETGTIGLLVFSTQLMFAWNQLRFAIKNSEPLISRLANTWFIVFIIMLLGGITKQDHYDKLVWMVIGISALPLWTNKSVEDTDVRTTN